VQNKTLRVTYYTRVKFHSAMSKFFADLLMLFVCSDFPSNAVILVTFGSKA
jgi:hypothetical protein